MATIQMLALIFLAGLTLAGSAATLIELLARRELRSASPFVSRSRPIRSAAVTLLAGPFMLRNDALDARRAGLISRFALLACAAAAALWTLGWGAVVLTLAARLWLPLA